MNVEIFWETRYWAAALALALAFILLVSLVFGPFLSRLGRRIRASIGLPVPPVEYLLFRGWRPQPSKNGPLYFHTGQDRFGYSLPAAMAVEEMRGRDARGRRPRW